MRSSWVPVLFLLVLLTVIVFWLRQHHPEYLPQAWQPHAEQPIKQSKEETPTVYRWKDDQGTTQLTDTPPKDRPYETVRIDPNRNIVPSILPSDDTR